LYLLLSNFLFLLFSLGYKRIPVPQCDKAAIDLPVGSSLSGTSTRRISEVALSPLHSNSNGHRFSKFHALPDRSTLISFPGLTARKP
jgi:hypothetical protein